MFLNKHNLAVAALASRDASRLSITGVHVSPTATTATDGYCLGRVTLPQEKHEDFPAVGVEEATEPLKPCIIPRDAAERLAKQLPKRTHIPILSNALVDVKATTGQIGTFLVMPCRL